MTSIAMAGGGIPFTVAADRRVGSVSEPGFIISVQIFNEKIGNGSCKKETEPGAHAGSRPRRRQTGPRVRYESRKTGRSKSAVKRAVKKVGHNRRRVDRSLGR